MGLTGQRANRANGDRDSVAVTGGPWNPALAISSSYSPGPIVNRDVNPGVRVLVRNAAIPDGASRGLDDGGADDVGQRSPFPLRQYWMKIEWK